MSRLGILFVLAAIAFGAGKSAKADDVALSLVNPEDRIDVPASAIIRAEPREMISFRNTDTGELREYPNSHIEVCFSKEVRDRICRLTQRTVGQPLAIVIDCRTVAKPILREPLCTQPCFQISTGDFAEATALAQQIRSGTHQRCTP